MRGQHNYTDLLWDLASAHLGVYAQQFCSLSSSACRTGADSSVCSCICCFESVFASTFLLSFQNWQIWFRQAVNSVVPKKTKKKQKVADNWTPFSKLTLVSRCVAEKLRGKWLTDERNRTQTKGKTSPQCVAEHQALVFPTVFIKCKQGKNLFAQQDLTVSLEPGTNLSLCAQDHNMCLVLFLQVT